MFTMQATDIPGNGRLWGVSPEKESVRALNSPAVWPYPSASMDEGPMPGFRPCWAISGWKIRPCFPAWVLENAPARIKEAAGVASAIMAVRLSISTTTAAVAVTLLHIEVSMEAPSPQARVMIWAGRYHQCKWECRIDVR